jgi:Na+/pantothenate symporter
MLRNDVLWPIIVMVIGVVALVVGAYLFKGIIERGETIHTNVDEPVPGTQFRSAVFMLSGWYLVGIGLVWLVAVVAWRLVT